MAKIPLGNFDSVGAAPQVAQNRVIIADNSGQARAGQQIGASIAQAGFNVMDQMRQEDKALARVKASNALLDRETQISTITNDLAEQVKTGKLTYDKLEDSYNGAVSKLDPLTSPGLDEAEMEGMGLAAKKFQVNGMEKIRAVTAVARVDAAKGDLATRMDMLGKDAAMPGANIDQINSRMDAEDIDVAGRLAYGEMWPSKKQEFRDDNWTTHATQRVIEARDGIGGLQKLEHDLTAEDGFYSRKLDPDKRNQLLNTVTGRIYQIKEQQQRQAEMRELKAERALTQMDRQAASGVPPTPADQQRWRATLSGTSAAGEFNTRMAEMTEVQKLLRAPIAEQQQYIDDRRQQMAANGGSVSSQANIERLQKAVDTNTKMLRENPLGFSALRTGTDVEPLDISGIGTPGGQQKLAEQMAHRFDVVNTVRKGYGPEVARVPFKPEEVAMLSAAVSQASDDVKLQLFGAIAASAPDGASYAAAIKPLTADQPITVLAGLAQFRQLKGADGTDVPKMLLAGSKVLADKSSPMPKDAMFRDRFDQSVGNSLVPGTPQREQAFLAFKSLYAGMAGPKGVTHDGPSPEIDRKLAEQAITLSTGGVAERAGEKVVKPYGMPDKAFDKAVDVQLQGLATSSKMSLDQLEDMPLSPVPGKEGVYYLMNAGRVQLDPATNQPLTVNIK